MCSARIIGAVLTIVTVPALVAMAVVYGISESKLRRPYDAPLVPLRVSAAPDVVEGERMARIVGCWDGCHGRVGEGGWAEVQGIFQNTAPTLSEVMPLYSDDELVRLIRYGVKRDGRSAVGMISYTFWALGDRDLRDIITHLRMQPVLPSMHRELQITWRGRLSLVTGAWKVAVEQVDHSRPRWGDLPQTTVIERGRYLASVTCSECHGLDYGGDPLEQAPSLAIVGAYSLQDFMQLMRTAQPIGGRKLNKNMTWVANAPFTDDEIEGLYAFLREFHGFSI